MGTVVRDRRLLSRGRRGGDRSGTDRSAAALLALAIAAAVAGIVAGVSSDRRAIRALPAQQRLAVLSRTVDELRRSCGEGRPAALGDHCRELASFAARFDECRAGCEELVRRELASAPTR